MAEFLVFVIVLATVIYLFNRSRKVPKELENIPHISGLPLIWAYLRNKHYDEISDIAVKTSKGHGIYVSTIASFKQVAITNPDYAKALLMESEDNAPKYNEYPPGHFLPRFFGCGLSFANGDRWRTYRKLANPAFNKALYPEIVGEPMLEFLSFMEKNFTADKPANIYDLMQRQTLEVLGKLVFGHRFDCFDSEETPQLIQTYKYIMSTIEAPLPNIFPWIGNLPLESNRKFDSAVDKFDEFIYGLIRTKRKEIANQPDSKNDREDLLTIILRVMEQDGITSANIKELRDDMINYFVAGHDTTSMALSASFYYLARHPEMQDKAREEVINAMGDKPMTIPSSEQLKEFKYISAIIKESLRVHPPAPIMTFRQLAKPVKIGPHTLPKNTLCSINAWQIHHDPKYWDNPNQYNPERFLNNEKRHPYAWIPFSAGTRNCVGQNYTLMAQKVVLAMTLLKYNWSLPENSINKEKLMLEPNFLVLKPVDLQIMFAERN